MKRIFVIRILPMLLAALMCFVSCNVSLNSGDPVSSVTDSSAVSGDMSTEPGVATVIDLSLFSDDSGDLPM